MALSDIDMRLFVCIAQQSLQHQKTDEVGWGRIGMLANGQVFKFNTHRSQYRNDSRAQVGDDLYNEMKQSCERLRMAIVNLTYSVFGAEDIPDNLKTILMQLGIHGDLTIDDRSLNDRLFARSAVAKWALAIKYKINFNSEEFKGINGSYANGVTYHDIVYGRPEVNFEYKKRPTDEGLKYKIFNSEPNGLGKYADNLYRTAQLSGHTDQEVSELYEFFKSAQSASKDLTLSEDQLMIAWQINNQQTQMGANLSLEEIVNLASQFKEQQDNDFVREQIKSLKIEKYNSQIRNEYNSLNIPVFSTFTDHTKDFLIKELGEIAYTEKVELDRLSVWIKEKLELINDNFKKSCLRILNENELNSDELKLIKYSPEFFLSLAGKSTSKIFEPSILLMLLSKELGQLLKDEVELSKYFTNEHQETILNAVSVKINELLEKEPSKHKTLMQKLNLVNAFLKSSKKYAKLDPNIVRDEFENAIKAAFSQSDNFDRCVSRLDQHIRQCLFDNVRQEDIISSLTSDKKVLDLVEGSLDASFNDCKNQVKDLISETVSSIEKFAPPFKKLRCLQNLFTSESAKRTLKGLEQTLSDHLEYGLKHNSFEYYISRATEALNEAIESLAEDSAREISDGLLNTYGPIYQDTSSSNLYLYNELKNYLKVSCKNLLAADNPNLENVKATFNMDIENLKNILKDLGIILQDYSDALVVFNLVHKKFQNSEKVECVSLQSFNTVNTEIQNMVKKFLDQLKSDLKNHNLKAARTHLNSTKTTLVAYQQSFDQKLVERNSYTWGKSLVLLDRPTESEDVKQNSLKKDFELLASLWTILENMYYVSKISTSDALKKIINDIFLNNKQEQSDIVNLFVNNVRKEAEEKDSSTFLRSHNLEEGIKIALRHPNLFSRQFFSGLLSSTLVTECQNSFYYEIKWGKSLQ